MDFGLRTTGRLAGNQFVLRLFEHDQEVRKASRLTFRPIVCATISVAGMSNGTIAKQTVG